MKVVAKNKKDEQVEFSGDYCLIAVGRRPYTDNLGLEKIGVTLDGQGRIPVNEHLETVVQGIYAIGDVIAGAMLAHKAEEEGVFVAETMVGQKPHINYKAIPEVLYTWPEAAGVGFTEDELKAENYDYKTGSFPFKALGRARVSMDTDGVCLNLRQNTIYTSDGSSKNHLDRTINGLPSINNKSIWALA